LAEPVLTDVCVSDHPICRAGVIELLLIPVFLAHDGRFLLTVHDLDELRRIAEHSIRSPALQVTFGDHQQGVFAVGVDLEDSFGGEQRISAVTCRPISIQVNDERLRQISAFRIPLEQVVKQLDLHPRIARLQRLYVDCILVLRGVLGGEGGPPFPFFESFRVFRRRRFEDALGRAHHVIRPDFDSNGFAFRLGGFYIHLHRIHVIGVYLHQSFAEGEDAVPLAGLKGSEMKLLIGPGDGLVLRKALRELFEQGQLLGLVGLQIDEIQELSFV